MKRKLMQTLVVVAVLAGVLAAMTGSAAAQEDLPNTLTVVGVGVAAGAPDVAFLQLGVQSTGSDVVTVFNDTNNRMNAVRDALLGQGIAAEDLQTTGLSLYQETPYDPQTGMPSQNVIYRATNSLNITIRDLDKVGDIISAGVNAGANLINSLTFGLSEPAALQAQAREKAVANALARAEQLAGLTGVTLGAPTIIVEDVEAGSPSPRFDMAVAYGMGGSGAAPVESGQLNVTVQVRVTYSIGS